MEHVQGVLILAAFVAIAATMFGRRENWGLFGLVVFALSVLAIYVALTVSRHVVGSGELTP
jgi:hypothetical protein